ALGRTAGDIGYDAPLIAAVEAVNNRQKTRLFEKMASHFGGADGLKGKRVAVWGLAFKPNTDDMRDSPALDLVPALIAAGARVQAFDPEGMHEARALLDGVDFRDGPYDAVKDADVVVIVTEWDPFRALDLDRLKSLVRQPVIVDLRNIYRPEDMRAKGFRYTSIGRA
ncbi:MAG TPA: UDP-glucose 6-dehydrogenase, partial [Brevundimonas sp.]|nr:UDP-glucose 6-dehydrogenase [Brevundimonas sp.]